MNLRNKGGCSKIQRAYKLTILTHFAEHVREKEARAIWVFEHAQYAALITFDLPISPSSVKFLLFPSGAAWELH